MAREVLKKKVYPYLYLGAIYLKVNRGGSVTDLTLLAAVGVDEEGFREALVVEAAGGERSAAYAALLRGLLDRGLKGVRLVVSDNHEGIKAAAISSELPFRLCRVRRCWEKGTLCFGRCFTRREGG